MANPRARVTAPATTLSVLVLLALHVMAAESIELSLLRRDGVELRFVVEVARAPAERARGLMWRSTLPPRHGMLFDFERMRRVEMWMKDTLIPLDMLFVDEDGLVIHIEHDTEPHSLRVIRAPSPSRYVLELNGGESRRLGLAPGDRLNLAAPAD